MTAGYASTRDSSQVRPLMLAYHEVGGESLYAYSIGRERFREHIAFVKNACDGARQIEVSFDDGHASCFEQALPILEDIGVKAKFFVTVQWMESRPNYMTWAQLREMSRLGHSIQSHTWSHKFLTACSDAQLESELSTSKRELEDRLGTAVDAVSAPGGRWNGNVVRQCGRLGYKRLYVSEPWVHKTDAAVSVLGRVMVRRSTTVAEIQRLSEHDSTMYLAMRGKAAMTGMMRGVLGDDRYLRLWRVVSRKRHDDRWNG